MLIALLLLVFVFVLFSVPLADDFTLLEGIAIFLLLVFGVLLVDFICKKNGLTKNNTLAPFVFLLALMLFGPLLLDIQSVVSGIFILIAIRRTISLQTFNNTTQKVFDSTFWILLASLFNEWCLLFILMVYAALLLFKLNQFRLYLVPWVAVVIVGILAFTYAYVFEDLSLFERKFGFATSFDFSSFTSFPMNLLLAFLAFLTIGSLLNYLAKTKKQKGVRRETSLLILSIFVIGALVLVLSRKENFTNVVYFLFPVSLMIAVLLQWLPKRWMKELTLGLCAAIALASLMF